MEKGDRGALHASLLLDGEDRVLEGNRDAEVFLERPLEEARKTPLREVNPLLYSALKDLLAKTRRGRGVENYAMAYRLGKHLLRLNVSITPYPLEALGSTGSMVSITTTLPGAAAPPRRPEGAQLTMLVPEAAVEIRGFLDRLADPAFLLDGETGLVYANAALCQALGHTAEEVLGRPLSFFLVHEKAKKTLEYLAETVHATPWRGELEFKRPDGTLFVLAVTVILWSEAGETVMLGLGRDVTSEARLKKERNEELRRVWNLLDSTRSPLICFTPDYRVTLMSSRAEELLGVSRDRAIGALLGELFPDEARSEVEALAEGVVARGEEMEKTVTIRTKRGKKNLRLTARPAYQVRNKIREYALLMQEEAGEAEEMAALRDRVASLDMRWKIMERAARSKDWEQFLDHCLELAEDVVGYQAGAAFLLEEGQASLEASRGLGERDRERLRRIVLRPGYTRVCREAAMFRLGIHGGVPREGWEDMSSMLERPETLVSLLRERRWRSLLLLPLRAEDSVVGALVFADPQAGESDEAAEKALQSLGRDAGEAMLALRPRMASRAGEPEEPGSPGRGGDGASAPDGTGPEGEGAQGAGGMDRKHSRGQHLGGGGEEEHDYLQIARLSRGDEVPMDLLAAPGEEAVPRVVLSARGIDLAALARDLRDYYARRGRAGEIFLELEEDLPRVHADKRLLREALMCLLDNAFRFSPPGSPVILGVERWGDEILLRVEDQGPGIPDEVIREITRADAVEEQSRPEGRRARSLLVCRRFVKSMGGELSFKATPGEGTVAYVRIPVLPFISEVS
ncbi:PAS domain S-box protein [Candidatus Solincola tengchongensis]|uniref:sensor histidine kinase n=1 Tax=Candidatus Solincola tengchongensis TaxID=2900693 RepID=UPI00257F4166|nr:PAS domain S-box protein [Candidatus Solincola tengchongensis]